MTTWWFLLLLTLPIPWVAKIVWPHEIKLIEIGITLFASTVVMATVFFTGRAVMTADREIWNGEITSKSREHGHYLRPYDCNCHDSCSGSGKNRSCSRVCDTCYEDRYTVQWSAASTIGSYSIDSEDWSNRGVYSLPDPARYAIIKPGDACSKSMSYTNYVKAVPESLFHADPLLTQKFAGKIPAYPDNIFDFYHINRALSAGVPVPDLNKWNEGIGLALRRAGTAKQANAIVVFVNTADSSYQQALESAWIGGKKNDVIIIIGTAQYPKIDWVAVSSWSKSELFKVELRDDIMTLGSIDRVTILGLMEKHILKNFERRHMKEFEYLAEEIEPPTWCIILAAILGLSICLGGSWYFYKNDLG